MEIKHKKSVFDLHEALMMLRLLSRLEATEGEVMSMLDVDDPHDRHVRQDILHWLRAQGYIRWVPPKDPEGEYYVRQCIVTKRQAKCYTLTEKGKEICGISS